MRPKACASALAPGGETIGYLYNGDIVILLAESAEEGGQSWQRIRTLQGVEGWIVQALVVQVTAVPTPTP